MQNDILKIKKKQNKTIVFMGICVSTRMYIEHANQAPARQQTIIGADAFRAF